jgi:putative ABC transport system permease protein
MLPRDIVATAWESLKAHRLRTGLSILGILIGIASFSVMYSVGESARQRTVQALHELGGDVIQIVSRAPAKKGDMRGGHGELSLREVFKIKHFCPAVSDVSPEIKGETDFFRRGKTMKAAVVGILPNYQQMFKLQVQEGRPLTQLDVDAEHQACLVGIGVIKRIFKDRALLKKGINIKGYLFDVVGIMQDSGQFGMISNNENIIIPLNMARRLFPNNDIRQLYVRSHNSIEAIAQLKQFFQANFGNSSQFEIRSQKLLLETQQSQIKIFEYILWTIGSISLLVGGIGIMNIMLVSVTERVREVGIRRALGATKWEIKIQFLCEAILLCMVGALGGTLLGFLGAKLLSHLFHFPFVFSVKVLLIALSIASVLGIVCGTYPAARAAEQDPTVVLRYE